MKIPAPSIGPPSLASFKNAFFDRDLVQKRADRARLKALSRFGSFVRTAAQRSMRKRKGPSKPGQPPSAHENPLLRKFLFFGYDAATESVVVGPVALNGRRGRQTIPEMHEYGGGGAVVLGFVKGKWRPVKPSSPRKFPWLETKSKASRYQPRPFMRPALMKERGKFAGLFRDSIS